MVTFSILIMFLLLACLLPLALANDFNQFIVGGRDGDIKNHKYQGTFRFGGEHNCGCVLVAPSWVVSAAHCGGDKYFTIAFGSADRRKGTEVRIQRVMLHPDYGRGIGSFPNDVSVVELKTPVYGDNIEPIAIGRYRLQGGEKAVITGWGRTCGYCGVPIALRVAELDILSHSECRTYWKDGYNPDGHVCVMDRRRKSLGGCSGDSGGPMRSGNEVHGVTSWGLSSCSPSYPTVYTRLSTFRSWICKKTNFEALGCR